MLSSKQLSDQKKHRIGLYIRVSTIEQASNPEGSIKSQEQRLRQSVNFRNIEYPFGEIEKVFIDRAKSGKDTKRPELQKMLRAVQNQEIDLVMVTELSRLSRSLKDFCEIFHMMKEFGCGFQSLREQYDTTTAAGEMILYMVANLAQFERCQTSERVSANFLARTQRGLYNGGPVPFGLKLNPEKKGYLLIDEPAAFIVKESFSTFVKEGSLSLAAKKLNNKGYKITRRREGGGNKTRLGHFTVTNLYRILKQRAYIGEKAYTLSDGKKKYVKACWPSIVKKETFDKVQKILESNHRTLMKWRYEILNYFKTRITNARTEAFNNIAKLLKRNSFGIKQFKHYRLRVLNVAF